MFNVTAARFLYTSNNMYSIQH